MPRLVPVLFVAAAIAGAAPARADQLPESAPRVVDYRISVTLDPGTKTLTGRERLVWRNPSDDEVPDLWFHLYLNAFRNTESTFYRESGGQLRGDRMTDGSWGWTDVTALRLADGTDLLPSLTFEHPDDDNTEDRTVARAVLPAPVAPGATVELDIEFTAKLPQVFARTGYRRDFYLVGQWFPKLGVYEPAGLRGRETGGWNCHQFHANSEFYADFGHFVVDITVPASFVVGATGVRIAAAEHDNQTTTYTYEQADVHDFAWTADPNYVEITDTFRAADEVSEAEYAEMAAWLDRPIEEVRLSDVAITVLMQPSRLGQAGRYMDAAKQSLKYFGLWYGRYPYASLTVVDPAPGAGGAGGMEYPTFITAGSAWVLGFWPLNKVRGAEVVTVHEFGHQFWYGMVGSNEFEEAWLDEGINSYSTGLVMERAYGSMVDLPGLRMTEEQMIRMSNGPEMIYDVSRQPSWTYRTPSSYGFYAYEKPEIVLRTLQHYLGDRTMARVMRTFQERWRFRHPSSDDFYAVANEVSGQDLTWFFEQAIESAGLLDHEVTVSTTRVTPPRGRLGDESTVAAGGEEETDDDAPGTWESTVVVSNRGPLRFPVDVEVKFEGAAPERFRWDGRDGWKRFRFVRPGRLEWADVDPDRQVTLDAWWLNNARRTRPDTTVAAHWTARVAFWLQNVIASVVW